jgi:branched-chain amino acid transport system permease protein
MFDAILQGILLGGYYAILAAGLSLMLGVTRFLNLAHGDLAILGAYIVLYFIEALNMPVGWAILAMLPIMAVVGWVLQTALFARTMRGGFLLPLLTAFGLGAVIQNGLFGLFSSDNKTLGSVIGKLAWSSWKLPFDIRIGKLPGYTFLAAVLILVGLQLLLSYTKLGRAMRATTTDQEAAELCGVDAKTVQRITVAIAVMLAGVAGVALSMRSLINPYAGPAQLIFAFEAVVIGGIGSLWGTLIGGIVLGIAQSVGAVIAPQIFMLSGHVVFLIVLAWRLRENGSFGLGGMMRFLKGARQ